MPFFADKSLNFFSLSLVFHLVFLGLFFLFSYAHINYFDNNLNYVDRNFDVINVNFVEIAADNSISTTKVSNPLDKLGYLKSKKEATNTTPHPINNSTASDTPSAETASQRYEYLLSQRFTTLFPLINELFFNLNRIDIWVKLDSAGNIVDSGIAENIPLAQLIEVKKAIIKLSPLPKPPTSDLEKHDIQQYLIPILIK